jgi:hypothetical protein
MQTTVNAFTRVDNYSRAWNQYRNIGTPGSYLPAPFVGTISEITVLRVKQRRFFRKWRLCPTPVVDTDGRDIGIVGYTTRECCNGCADSNRVAPPSVDNCVECETV